jgi:hypothetical protein
MRCGRLMGGMLALGLFAVFVVPASAERTATTRTGGQKSTGSRPDITVPYLTNGTDAFKGGKVAPKIYNSPNMDDPKNPQVKPVYNLIFYGSKQSFGDKSNGAGERPANSLRPTKSP